MEIVRHYSGLGSVFLSPRLSVVVVVVGGVVVVVVGRRSRLFNFLSELFKKSPRIKIGALESFKAV